MGYNELLKEIVSEIPRPVWRLEVGTFYQFRGDGSPFSKSFMFRVLDDSNTHYVILIEEDTKIRLDKTYELIDSINQGIIKKLGTAEELGLGEFDIRDFLDEVEEIKFEDEE